MNKTTALLFLLSGSLVFSGAVPAHAADEASPPSITITLNDEYTNPVSQPPILLNGTTYVHVRDLARLLSDELKWDERTQTAVYLSPSGRLTLSLSPYRLSLNGKPVTLTHKAISRSGRIFVPLKDFAGLLGVQAGWDAADRTIELHSASRYWKASDQGTLVWFDSLKRTVTYLDEATSMPVVVPTSLPRVKYGIHQAELQVRKLNGGAVLASFTINYGEPGIFYADYRVLVNGRKAVDTSVAVYQTHMRAVSLNPVNPLSFDNRALLFDGKRLRLENSQGTVLREVDLPQITGLDDVFTVEQVFDDYLLVRPNGVYTLIGIDLRTDTADLLYRKLVPVEDQKIIDGWEWTAVDYPSDGLTFLRRDGQKLIFRYKHPLTHTEETVTYEIPRPDSD
ncbi:copper amine oxidase N-terminal domain-containing protein [Gorillibacterium sp. sgz500922]|uniref:copper amine oxidase N-terminal domain-containing protein n=1 Tax=Gorillibacterium sp. sgz500922 TaxID=3446694 RepID=UPI003F664B7E